MKTLTKNNLALLAAALLPLSLPAADIQVTQPITNHVTWYRTNTYFLNGAIYVLSNATLTIEAGTVIKGRPGGTNDASFLAICQGAKIFAEGSPTQPIIFTAEEDDVTDPDDLGIYDRGRWGGLVIFGRAPINMATDSAGNAANPKYEVYEGLSDIQINGQYVNRFGGNDPDDNSGILRYVSIRHGGVKILPNREINGLSLGGVGRGTTIEFVEAYAIADDGFEFFGGTVNSKYLVSAFCDDDAFDADMGWTGKNQFWLAIQERGAKDNGAEFNGEINGAVTGTQTPIANYEIYNATWIGAGTNTAGNRALQLRDYAAPKIYNSIITEFGGFGVRIDGTAAIHLTNGLLDLRDNLWWNFATNGVPVAVAESSAAQLLFTDTARNNTVEDPMLRGISRNNNPAFQLDPRPQPSSPALTSARTAPNDGFYTPVNYKGAFGHINWASDWTALATYGILTTAGGGIPPALIPGTTPAAAALAAGKQNGSLVIGISGSPNGRYQLQAVERLGQTWLPVGEPVVLNAQGRGQFVIPMEGTGRFFRLQSLNP